MILISGATGHLGKAVVDQLLARGALGQFAILVRNEEKAKPFVDQGIEVRIADFDHPKTLDQAFSGIDKFLFISTMSMERGAQQSEVVKAATVAGMRHIFYTGLAIRDIAHSHTRDLMQSHFDTEEHIRNSGIKFTFFRNTIYAESLNQILGPAALENGIYLPSGTGKTPYATRTEMGEAIANALLGQGHEGKTYTITGLKSWSFDDIAKTLGQQTGRTLPYVNISAQDLETRLKAAGLPDFAIWLTLNTIQDIKEGQYDIPSNDLETLLGRDPKDLPAMLSEIFA